MSKRLRLLLFAMVLAALSLTSCTGFQEDSLNSVNIHIGTAFTGIYHGAAEITLTGKNKTFVVSTSEGYLGDYAEAEYDFIREVTVSTVGCDSDSVGLFVFGKSDSEEAWAGGFPGDSAVIKVIIRQDDRISGYALIAFWDKQGSESSPYFVSGKVLKAVEFQAVNGEYPTVSESDVNALLDQAEKELVTEELLASHCPMTEW